MLLHEPLSSAEHDAGWPVALTTSLAHGEAHRLRQHVVKLHRQIRASHAARLAPETKIAALRRPRVRHHLSRRQLETGTGAPSGVTARQPRWPRGYATLKAFARLRALEAEEVAQHDLLRVASGPWPRTMSPALVYGSCEASRDQHSDRVSVGAGGQAHARLHDTRRQVPVALVRCAPATGSTRPPRATRVTADGPQTSLLCAPKCSTTKRLEYTGRGRARAAEAIGRRAVGEEHPTPRRARPVTGVGHDRLELLFD